MDLLNAAVPVFLIIIAGFAFDRFRWLPDGLDTGVMQLAIKLLVPCLIFDKVVGSPALDHVQTVFFAIGLGFAHVAISLVICFAFAPALGLKKGLGLRSFALSTAIQNYGFIALPVLGSLFGDGPAAMLFLYGMGVEVATWTLGVGVLSGFGGGNWKRAINPPLLAVCGGLAIHYSGVGTMIPGALDRTITWIGGCAVPMCLLMIGITISQQSRSADWALRWPTVLGACGLRLVLLPFLILASAAFLPISIELKQVLLVQASMPAAIFPIVLTRMYGGHPPTAIQVVVVTTGLCIVTMPLWIYFARPWLGL
ncbi:MAG: putative permease [Verrucomicrobiales bacterium]|jgi:predicted permease